MVLSNFDEVRGPLAVRFRRNLFPRCEHHVLFEGSKVRRNFSSREQWGTVPFFFSLVVSLFRETTGRQDGRLVG